MNSEEKAQQLSECLLKHQEETQESLDQELMKALKTVEKNEITRILQLLLDQGIPVKKVRHVMDLYQGNTTKKKDSEYCDETECQHECETCSQNYKDHKVTPIKVMKAANYGIRSALKFITDSLQKEETENLVKGIRKAFSYLGELSDHYGQKESLFFPYLNLHGIYSFSQVMWSIDDVIRKNYTELFRIVQTENPYLHQDEIRKFVKSVSDMADKEDNTLYPLLEKTLTEEEFSMIAYELPDLGYPFLKSGPTKEMFAAYYTFPKETKQEGFVNLPTGRLTFEQLESVLNSLDAGITFIDDSDRVTYFNRGRDPIVIRTMGQLGQEVELCLPAKKSQKVQEIIKKLKAGDDKCEMIFKEGDKLVYKRYLAVRNSDGVYLGVAVISQDITSLTECLEKLELN